MKEFCFSSYVSSYGVPSQTFKYELEITSAKLAEEMDISVEEVLLTMARNAVVGIPVALAEQMHISVEEVEAMTEEEMKALIEIGLYFVIVNKDGEE